MVSDNTVIRHKWVFICAAIFLLIFIFLPFSFYYLWKIYKNADSIIIHKRFPYLILVTVIGNCIYLSTEKTVILLISFTAINISYTSREHIEFVVYAAIHWVFIYALYISVLRFWLLYFKLEWALSNINNKWQSIINSRFSSKDWFLKRKKTYGSYTWLIKKVFAFSTILVIFNLFRISFFYFSELQNIGDSYTNGLLSKYRLLFDLLMGTIIYSPALLTMFYIIWKLPSFDDHLLIRKEAKFSIVIFILLIVMNLICGIIHEKIFFFEDMFISHDYFAPIIDFIVYVLSLIGFFALNYKQTRWVWIKFEKIIRRYSSRQLNHIAFDHEHHHNDDYKQLNENELVTSDSNFKKRHIKLEHILNHDKAYDLFINFLYKQHCSEVILSLTEITQFQQLIYDDLCKNLTRNLVELENNNNANNKLKSTIRKHKKSVSLSLSLKSLTPFNNHNRNGKNYKPFEIKISNNTNDKNNVNALELVSWNSNNNLDNENMERKSLNIADQQISKMGEHIVCLPPTVPRSSIVYDRFELFDRKDDNNNVRINKLIKYRLIAYDIYDKYIRTGSEHEINIDYANRKKYNNLLGNKNKWIIDYSNYIDNNKNDILYNEQYIQEAMVLFQLYQPCIDQMYRFCSSCFITFKNTDAFDHLTDLFTIKNI